MFNGQQIEVKLGAKNEVNGEVRAVDEKGKADAGGRFMQIQFDK